MIRYRLDDAQASRRARVAALVGAAGAIAPILLAVVLLRRLGWAPEPLFWAVVGALVVLVVVRAMVGYSSLGRRLRALVITLDDDAVRADGLRASEAFPRDSLEHVVEVDGALGGLRIGFGRDPDTGEAREIRVPRGGDGYAEVRARLETWRAIERRGRRGPLLRLAVGALVVAGIFFVPFLLDDFVARSRLLAAGLVAFAWIAMRTAMRGR